jgi:NAD(P)H dehydrogenase (quinone)
MYGHIRQLAEAEKKGIEAAGGEATLYQYVTSHFPRICH